MRILLVARWPVGGIRTYLRYVFRHDSLLGHDYALLAPNAAGLSYVVEGFADGACRHVVVGNSNLNVCRAAAREVRRWRPDLIHSHGFSSGILAAPAALMTRTPHLLTSHDVLFERQFPGWRGKVRRFGVGMALRSVDHLMAVGDDALENVRAFYPFLGHNGKTSAIQNGIDVDAFLGEARRDLRQELDLTGDTVLLGFFGRFMSQKGFNLLVDALERNRDQGLDVQVACFGWGGFIREEQDALRQRGLDAYFHFLPHTDDMAAALRGVDVVTMPSRWEACPLLPMEALVAGAPVIASDCIGMREVVRDTPALVFPSGDQQALSVRIEEAARRRNQLRALGEGFRQEAARRFGSAESARGLAALYERVTAGKGRS